MTRETMPSNSSKCSLCLALASRVPVMLLECKCLFLCSLVLLLTNHTSSHNHLEDSLQQSGMYVEEGKKEWEHYVAYVQSIDQFLKTKGLRYGKFAAMHVLCALKTKGI